MEHIELWKYVSISLQFEFYFKIVCKTILQYSGKKLLVSTKEILQNLHFKFRISEPHGLQILKFLIFSHDELVEENQEENDR